MEKHNSKSKLEKQATSSASFTRVCDPSKQDEDDIDIQITLAPYIQSYLAQSGQRVSCCGIALPVPFERASRRSWWDPRFDSEILEGQYRMSSFPQVQLRFQYALIYILVVSAVWLIYLVATGLQGYSHGWIALAVAITLLFISMSSFLVFTFSDIYRRYTAQISTAVAFIISALSLLLIAVWPSSDEPDISPVGQFGIAIEIVLLIYTVLPLPLYLCAIIGGTYSILFECLTLNSSVWGSVDRSDVVVRALLHVCVHLIGIHILIMTNVRMRGTFMKVGQSLLVRRQLEMEKLLKEKMILSVMPPKVAEWLLNEGGGKEYENTIRGNDFHSLFRPFNMVRMENVSILFADIVGFTRMSSNKSAEELVGILNDLFERFDEQCVLNGCEKISTLGDCYYCVSGCPEPKPDHAKACVEMGLSMIDAIQQFDTERNEGVNMRVGVHTGTVHCGIVGTCRFKFDVWSNDVTLANRMESTGKPGQVHISEATKRFLEDNYVLEQGDIVQGTKTYFIRGRKKKVVWECIGLVSAWSNNARATSMPSILHQQHKQYVPTTFASCAKFLPQTQVAKRYPKEHQRNSEEAIPLSLHETMQTQSMASRLNVPPTEHRLSVSRSINSRKDSGIRSNSRRSSIQQQLVKDVDVDEEKFILTAGRKIFVLNGITHGELLPHRVSGYYTSSQSSLDEDVSFRRSHLPPPLGENFGACFQKLRKQSDLQLIRCVQDNVTSHRSYFVKPPLSEVSLFFRQSEMELEYRANAHRVTEKHGAAPPTLATSRFNTYLDICISLLVFSAISSCLFLLYDESLEWILVFVLASLIQMLAVCLCVIQLIRSRSGSGTNEYLSKKIMDRLSAWYPRHLCGALLVSAPIISVLVNFSCARLFDKSASYLYSYMVFVGLVHFCNFTQLNCWMKSMIATAAGALFVALGACRACHPGPPLLNNSSHTNSSASMPFPEIAPSMMLSENISEILGLAFAQDQTSNLTNNSNITYALNSTALSLDLNSSIPMATYMYTIYTMEMFVDVILLLVLVWFLNREFEISYRLSFHSNFVAARDRMRVESMKNQADWLLHNIIPKHVADQLKNTAKYSENHKDVGVIFASIVNFNEMYDESYLGGKEFLRVLNELIGDFDELLTKPGFSNVEKIKTIGSTFMAASGLNPGVRRQSKHPHQHLYELMDFAIAMHHVIDSFNRDLLEFTLILRIGYNFGDVTAGVIGTTKLYYDIWGDAVNIASRMDSTGVDGRIQVGRSCMEVLNDKFSFEPRGPVYVKGKDNMNVYLLKGKRTQLVEDS